MANAVEANAVEANAVEANVANAVEANALLSCSGCQRMKERGYTTADFNAMTILCPSPDGYGNTTMNDVRRARKKAIKAKKSTYEVLPVGVGLKMADLCDDVLRLVCEYLDVESHIALYLAFGNAFGNALGNRIEIAPLVKKIKATRCIAVMLIKHFPRPDDRTMTTCIPEMVEHDTDLIYYVAMLKTEERAQLTQACGGEIPFNLMRNLDCLLPLLPDHSQLLNVTGYKAEAKRYLKKYGALRDHPSGREFIEDLAIKCARLKPTRVGQFITLAFDINTYPRYWNPSPTRQAPNCFRDPIQAMRKVLEGQSAEYMLNCYIDLLKDYQFWYKRFIRNAKRKQKYGTILTDAQARYDELIFLGPYLMGFE